MLLQQAHRQHQQIAKVGRVQLQQTRLIIDVHIQRIAAHRVHDFAFGNPVRFQCAVFPFLDLVQKGARRKAFGINTAQFKDLLDDAQLVIGI